MVEPPLLAAVTFQDLVERWFWTLVMLALVFLVAIVLQIVAARVLAVLVRAGHLPGPMAGRLRTASRWLLAVVVVASVLQGTHLFDQAWAVLSAMLVAIAVGFVALWSVLGNMTCALLILVFRPFRLGDQIELLEPADLKVGVSGKVTDLSLVFTTLALEEDEESIQVARIPNSIFFQKVVRVTMPRDVQHSESFVRP